MNRDDALMSLCHSFGADPALADFNIVAVHRVLDALIAAEREECAKVCDDLPVPPYVSDNDAHIWDLTCVDCAEAIRARGQE
jgi:hypothetical protein